MQLEQFITSPLLIYIHMLTEIRELASFSSSTLHSVHCHAGGSLGTRL